MRLVRLGLRGTPQALFDRSRMSCKPLTTRRPSRLGSRSRCMPQVRAISSSERSGVSIKYLPKSKGLQPGLRLMVTDALDALNMRCRM